MTALTPGGWEGGGQREGREQGERPKGGEREVGCQYFFGVMAYGIVLCSKCLVS